MRGEWERKGKEECKVEIVQKEGGGKVEKERK